MTSITNSDSGSSAAPAESVEGPWTLTSAARRHPRITAISLVVVLALLAVTLLTTVSRPHRQPLSGSASCSQWAAAAPRQQLAYSHLYIDEYGRSADTSAEAATVSAAITRGCTRASYLGEADDVSVLAALRHAF